MDNKEEDRGKQEASSEDVREKLREKVRKLKKDPTPAPAM